MPILSAPSSRLFMETPTPNQRGFPDANKRPWSPPDRPTVNTNTTVPPPHSNSSSTPLEHSPHLSSVSNSNATSPWLQGMSLASSSQSQPLPFPLQDNPARSHDLSSRGIASLSNTDWSAVFSSPLDPSTFAALAASGMIGPAQPTVPSSLPIRSLRSPPDLNPGTRLQPSLAKDPVRSNQAPPISLPWPVSSSYSSATPLSSRASPAQLNNASLGKRRSPINGINGHQLQGVDLAPLTSDRRALLAQQIYGPQLSNQQFRGGNLAYPPLDPSFHELTQALEHPSPLEYPPNLPFHLERSNVGIPPSLWMSPTSTTPSSPNNYPEVPPFNNFSQLAISRTHVPDSILATSSTSSSHSLFAESSKSTALTSTGSPKTARKFDDLFTDDLFSGKPPKGNNVTVVPPKFSSPVVSGSPTLKTTDLIGDTTDPEQMAKEDPLATQVWKMYARTKANLPHAQRMENLTWRMMALALKKKKEDEEKGKNGEQKPKQEEDSADRPDASSARPPGVSKEPEGEEEEERGRTIDKGKARVKVVGFDGANPDNVDENELSSFTLLDVFISPHFFSYGLLEITQICSFY
ncbi:hypothetical protein NLI96_g12413 [Meripilus lineatus]|uniref:Nitrogen regulatory protein areA GATA-like domain-containing protein n=1 Tax=Meripilus lineatus TaxID=2056292 RepID=A0AAD5YCG1_9APHY|nr:hypothetical protein NLI96_g12413 [Physisporinus lineatus]